VPRYVRPEPDDAGGDAAAIQAAMEDLLALRISGWAPRAASPMRYLLEAAAIEGAETRRAATGEGQTFDAIARFFGTETFAIPAEDAAHAAAAATMTVKDAAGYEIPAGTQLTLLAADGSRAGFETVESVTVPAGQTSTAAGGVAIVALVAGAAGNGLQADAQLEEISDFVTAITVVAPSAGGQDGETDGEYLDRFTRAARRFSPRLITPRDVELYAADWPGAARAIAYDLRDPGANEVQTVSHAGTGGTLTLTFEGQTTAAIAWDATAAAAQAALEALSNVGAGDVRAAGGPWPAAITFEFVNGLAASNRTQMTSSNAALTPGASAITHATPTQGAAPATNQERKATVVAIDAAGESLAASDRAALETAMLAGVESGKLVYVREPSYAYVDVTFTATAYPDFVPATVEAAAEAAAVAHLSPAAHGVPRYGDPLRWLDEPLVRFRDMIDVLESVDGLWHVDSLTIMGAANADYALPGPKPNLPRPGAIAGTVVAG